MSSQIARKLGGVRISYRIVSDRTVSYRLVSYRVESHRIVIPCSCPLKGDMGLDFTNFTNFSRFVFSSKQLEYERYGDIVAPVEILAKNCIGWDGSRSIYFFRFFWSLFGPLFLIISSYFKPGSLGKSPEDLWESFLNIWLWSGTYNLSIYPEYVRKPSVIFCQHGWFFGKMARLPDCARERENSACKCTRHNSEHFPGKYLPVQKCPLASKNIYG